MGLCESDNSETVTHCTQGRKREKTTTKKWRTEREGVARTRSTYITSVMNSDSCVKDLKV